MLAVIPNFWRFVPILTLMHTRNPERKWIVKIPGVGKEMGFAARILTGVFVLGKFSKFFCLHGIFGDFCQFVLPVPNFLLQKTLYPPYQGWGALYENPGILNNIP